MIRLHDAGARPVVPVRVAPLDHPQIGPPRALRTGWIPRGRSRLGDQLGIVFVHVPVAAPLPRVPGHVEGAIRADISAERADGVDLLRQPLPVPEGGPVGPW